MTAINVDRIHFYNDEVFWNIHGQDVTVLDSISNILNQENQTSQEKINLCKNHLFYVRDFRGQLLVAWSERIRAHLENGYPLPQRSLAPTNGANGHESHDRGPQSSSSQASLLRPLSEILSTQGQSRSGQNEQTNTRLCDMRLWDAVTHVWPNLHGDDPLGDPNLVAESLEGDYVDFWSPNFVREVYNANLKASQGVRDAYARVDAIYHRACITHIIEGLNKHRRSHLKAIGKETSTEELQCGFCLLWLLLNGHTIPPISESQNLEVQQKPDEPVALSQPRPGTEQPQAAQAVHHEQNDAHVPDDDAIPEPYAQAASLSRPLQSQATTRPEHSWSALIPSGLNQYEQYLKTLPVPAPTASPMDSVRDCFGLWDWKTEDIERLLELRGHHALTVMKYLGREVPKWANTAREEFEKYCDERNLICRNNHYQDVTLSANGIPTHIMICKYERSFSNGCRKADCHFSHTLGAHICKHWLSGAEGCAMREKCPFSHNPFEAVVRGKEPDIPGHPKNCKDESARRESKVSLQIENAGPGPVPDYYPEFSQQLLTNITHLFTGGHITDSSRPTTAQTDYTSMTASTRDTTAPTTPRHNGNLQLSQTAIEKGKYVPGVLNAPTEPAADRIRRLRQQQQQQQQQRQFQGQSQGQVQGQGQRVHSWLPRFQLRTRYEDSRTEAPVAESSRSAARRAQAQQGHESEEKDLDTAFPCLNSKVEKNTRKGERNN